MVAGSWAWFTSTISCGRGRFSEGGDGGEDGEVISAMLRSLGRRAVLFAMSAFSAISALACEDPGVKPTTTVQAADSADQVLEGFSHYVTNEGILRSRVEADTAFFYEPTQVTELHNVKVVFFDIKGAESSTLTAKRGIYRWQDGSM